MLNFIEGLNFVYTELKGWNWVFWLPALWFIVLTFAGAWVPVEWKEATRAIIEDAWPKLIYTNWIFLVLLVVTPLTYMLFFRSKSSKAMEGITTASIFLYVSTGVIMSGMLNWYQGWSWLRNLMPFGRMEAMMGASGYLAIVLAIIISRWMPEYQGPANNKSIYIQEGTKRK